MKGIFPFAAKAFKVVSGRAHQDAKKVLNTSSLTLTVEGLLSGIKASFYPGQMGLNVVISEKSLSFQGQGR